MKTLTDWFDRVFVINCQHRPDRLAAVKDQLTTNGMADLEKVTFFRAIVGDFVTCPADWATGNGAWGCWKSHSRIAEDVLHARDERAGLLYNNYLVLEDDVFFLPNALEDLNTFMEALPPKWDQIYLGGQHRMPVSKTENPRVVVGNSVHRTHAYALSSKAFTRFYRHINYATDYRGTLKHIDHQLELAHQRRDWTVYCPEKWICGQDEGHSNVYGAVLERRTWMGDESK